MNGRSLRDLMREIMVEVGDVAPDAVQEESTLDGIGIDSLAVAELVVELEIRIKRQLPTAVLRRLAEVQTFGQMADELAAALGVTTPAIGDS